MTIKESIAKVRSKRDTNRIEKRAGSPPYPRLMPWLLVFAGIALFALALSLHSQLQPLSHVSEIASGTSPSASTGKVTDTSAVLSDATFLTLVTLSAVLILGGAFYGRISKINLPGGASIEMVALTNAALAMSRLQKKGRVPKDTSPVTALAAVQLAAQSGVGLSKLTQIDPILLKNMRPLSEELSDEEVAQLQEKGVPPDDLWDRLAEAALKQVSSGDRTAGD